MEDFHLLIKNEGRYYLANPASSFTITPPEQPWTREATERDVNLSLSQHDTELVDILSKSYAEHELSDVLETLGLSREYLALIRKEQTNKSLTFEQAYFRTALCGVMMDAIIEKHGAVTTPAILNASLSELRIWEDHYFGQLEEIFEQQRGIEQTITSGSFSENAAWALCRARFCRIAGFLWEVRMRLSINVFSGDLKRETPQT